MRMEENCEKQICKPLEVFLGLVSLFDLHGFLAGRLDPYSGSGFRSKRESSIGLFFGKNTDISRKLKFPFCTRGFCDKITFVYLEQEKASDNCF